VGVALLLFAARAHRQPLGPFLDLLLAVLLAGVAGARAGYAVTHWSEFREDPWSLLFLWEGGLSFFGGFPPAFLAFLAVLRWRKIPILTTADFVSPILPFSLGLIRIGCFLQGCCYGLPTEAPWAVVYSRLDSKVPQALLDLPLHPTQLYEAVFLFALSLTLTLVLRKNPLRPGMLATFSIFAYGAYRFCADFFRADLDRGFLGFTALGASQLAALVGILATPVVLWICARSAREKA
jgi:phosphatidylglycerol:prolipoprotein diacylglycerol transferase